MSLKAKIEAVIYASEEPVTLSQLMGLLGQEAQAELDQIAEAQQALALESAESVEAESSEVAGEETDVEGGDHKIEMDSEGPTQEPVPALEAEDGVGTSEEQTETGSESDSAELYAANAESAAQISATADGAAEQGSAREAKEEKERNRRLREYFRSILDQLILEYANDNRGLEIREVANGYRMATKPEYHDAVRGFVKSLKPPLKLSLQALETLAVVAY
ncbi:MAG TPA: SMC-Scp complex subunit ScpB, partial [Edaphobacter sp.]|nr:SMC-Scp complex subunit ScpB [Edaphobacter sp.]